MDPIICDGVNLRCKVCGESLVGKIRYSNGRESWCLSHGKTFKGDGISKPCPTPETYQEAVELAEKEAQR